MPTLADSSSFKCLLASFIVLGILYLVVLVEDLSSLTVLCFILAFALKNAIVTS